VFTNPKPLSLIKYLANFKVLENDLILDFFAGSGTTAHAVMQLNAEGKGNRKFICVQLPEPTDEKSEAYKSGYKTIFDITKARIEKSAVKIRQDFKETTADLGFKIFKTEPHFQTTLNTDFDPQIDFLPKTDLNDKQLHTLLTTWRVFDGCRLPEKVQSIDLVGYTAYYCRQHLYLLASGFTSESVKALIEHLDNDKDFVPERIVLFGENIDSAMQKELAQAVKTYANKKGLNNLSVLARY
jgi:putative type III restriction-modification system methyltransferase